MPRFIKGVDLAPEQRKLVVEESGDFYMTKWEGGPTCAFYGRVMETYIASRSSRKRRVGKGTVQMAPPDEVEYILTKLAWCFSNDGKHLTSHAGHNTVRADAADEQNARLVEIETARKAKFRKVRPVRKCGEL